MDVILFDLDGTVTDPREGISKSFQYALREFGIETDDLTSLYRHIGPPLVQTFSKEYGFDEEKTRRAIVKYRERFAEKGIFENVVYPGMEHALERLKEAGKTIFLATSKPEHYAIQILKHFGLDGYFDDICGATFDGGARDNKESVISYALSKNQIKDLSGVIMVGDRCYDIIGAKACHIASMGVLYGFGDRKELEEAGADYIEESVESMTDRLLLL